MMDVLNAMKNQIIKQRDQVLMELDLKYACYINEILLQKTLVRISIQNQYDEQIRNIDRLSFINYSNNFHQTSNTIQNQEQNQDNCIHKLGIEETQPMPSPSASEDSDSCQNDAFYCIYCSKTFTKYESLRAHIPTHKNRRHLCTYCPSAFKDLSKRSQHMLQHGTDAVDRPYSCDICMDLFECRTCFSQPFALTQHISRVHKLKVKTRKVAEYHKKRNIASLMHLDEEDEKNINKESCVVQISGHKRKDNPSEIETECDHKRMKANKDRKDRNIVLECSVWRLWKLKEAKIKSDKVSSIGNTLRTLKNELKQFIINNNLCDEWISTWDKLRFSMLEQTILFNLCLKKMTVA